LQNLKKIALHGGLITTRSNIIEPKKIATDVITYQRANLKNILYAISSLYILILLIGKEFGFDKEAPISSRLFEDYIV